MIALTKPISSVRIASLFFKCAFEFSAHIQLRDKKTSAPAL
jgi:hypothetical protein